MTINNGYRYLLHIDNRWLSTETWYHSVGFFPKVSRKNPILSSRIGRDQVERQPRPQDISWFLDLNSREQLDLDPPYQRRSVWTLRDKEYFIDTIFHNYPSPAIFLHRTIEDNGKSVYHVVDGRQRLQTILEFTEGEVRIPKEFGDTRLNGKRWGELDTESKHKFWNYVLTVEILPLVDDAVVNNVFERINRNARKLTRQELRHAKYDGWFIDVAEKETEKEEWKKFGVVTTARAKRMYDVQFVSELMAVILKNRVLGFDQDDLDKIYADYDIPQENVYNFSEEEFTEKLENIKNNVYKALDIKNNIINNLRVLANFYSMWTFLVLEKPEHMNEVEFTERYHCFMEKVDNVIERSKDLTFKGEFSETDDNAVKYAINMRGAITDLRPRESRHQAITAYLKSNHENPK